jgi:effector-binding domain-containing protein
MAAPHEIRVAQVQAKPLAVIKGVAFAQNIGAKIGAALPLVFAKLKDLGVTDAGPAVVVYRPNPADRWDVPPGVAIEVGVELAAPLAAECQSVVASSIPTCRAATALHVGPYQALPTTHAAIRDWCHANGHALAGPNWEVYGDHHDDPAQLRTQVSYQLV